MGGTIPKTVSIYPEDTFSFRKSDNQDLESKNKDDLGMKVKIWVFYSEKTSPIYFHDKTEVTSVLQDKIFKAKKRYSQTYNITEHIIKDNYSTTYELYGLVKSWICSSYILLDQFVILEATRSY